MQIIRMMMEILLISNGVLHESRLPNTAPALFGVSLADFGFTPSRRGPILGEPGFDGFPSFRVTIVTGWKRPDRVKVIGKQNDRNLVEWALRQFSPNGLTQNRSGRFMAKKGPSARCNDREEIRSARYEIATKVGHGDCSMGTWGASFIVGFCGFL